jgi:hypothetical protein
VGYAELFGRRLFECGYRLTQDELLSFKDLADCLEQFLLERLVLAFEVQHGHRLGGLR